MSPRLRRIIIPLFVAGIAVGIVLSIVLGPPKGTPEQQPDEIAQTAESVEPTDDPAGSAEPDDEAVDADAGGDPVPDAPADVAPQGTVEPLGALRAVAPGRSDGATIPSPPTPLGSLDYRTDRMLVEFATHAAGISRVTFSDIWETSTAKRAVDALKKEIDAGTRTIDDLPASERYVLDETSTIHGAAVPILAAHSIQVDGNRVDLFGAVWDEIAPGSFRTEIRTESDETVLRITRTFTLGEDGFDLTLAQRIENRSGGPLSIRWGQYGPGDLREDRSRYMDRRRFRFGYLLDPQLDPERTVVLSKDDDLIYERAKVFKLHDKSRRDGLTVQERMDFKRLWPNKTSREEAYELSWFASTNRYFGLALHPVVDGDAAGSRALTDVVAEILIDVSSSDQREGEVFTFVYAPTVDVAAGATLAIDLGVFAGPLDPAVLDDEEPYGSLSMGMLVLYQMSSFCAICTFQWLAEGLLGFLSLLYNHVVFDWGVAIIILVFCVRLILHPVTKRSQIGMQRFGKQMSALKPEVEKLQKKYPNEPKRLQQEQMKLMREHGVNPFQMLGCLPMFLQMPIWVALYAMLYFAYELRHQPAFWGFFQVFWDWPFLADLSSADHFFGEFAEPRRFLLWNITGINLLPILMGVIFFVQQKYMSPPPTPNMSKEQIQQQKIMKVMMVVMFPVMLYSAPSGLTLYILTSSCIGILESRYVRKHINEMDLNPQKAKPKARTKTKDAQGRAFAAAVDRAKAKRKPPPKKYKRKKK